MSLGGRRDPFSFAIRSLEGALGPTGLAAATQIHILQKREEKKKKKNQSREPVKSDVRGFKRPRL